MKRVLFIITILFCISTLQAQKDTLFYKHEVRASLSDATLSFLWLQEDYCYLNFSVSYFYRPVKWFWVGGHFINSFGKKLDYQWREYGTDGSIKDFSKSKIKYCAVLAPEIRFSYLNRKSIILYSALSAGLGIEDGYDKRYHEYPRAFFYFHLSYFGLNCNFGKNKNIFLGTEFGLGYKGFVQIHGGYRF